MKRKKQRSLYTVSIRSMFLLVAIVLVSYFMIMRSAEHRISGLYREPDTEGLGRLIQKGSDSAAWDKIHAAQYLGEGGYFEILNADGSVFYSSLHQEHSYVYSGNVLNFIPGSDGQYYFEITPISNPDSSVYYQLSYYGGDGAMTIGASEVVIEDEAGHVLFANTDGSELVLSESELQTVSQELGSMYLQKAELTMMDGTARTAIFHCRMLIADDYDARMDFIYVSSIALFVIIVIFFIVLFTMHQKKAMAEPLEALDSAMKDFAAGSHGNTVSMDEIPSEFHHVVDTYNTMSVQLKESEDRQKHMEEERQIMIADISHDLRTPVTVISGYAAALEDGMVPKEEQKNYLHAISKKADTLSQLIESFYEYSRLEHPQFHLEEKEADIAEYFRAYLASKYEELEMQGFHLQTDLPENPVMAEFDPVHLQRLFENLIVNSIRHNEPGTTIYAAMKQTKDQVCIRIGDDGTGIPKEKRAEIFEPFVTGSTARTSGKGTGLGLAIARKVVEAHHGTIRIIDDETHQWSVLFEILLPLKSTIC